MKNHTPSTSTSSTLETNREIISEISASRQPGRAYISSQTQAFPSEGVPEMKEARLQGRERKLCGRMAASLTWYLRVFPRSDEHIHEYTYASQPVLRMIYRLSSERVSQ